MRKERMKIVLVKKDKKKKFAKNYIFADSAEAVSNK
jgi:hypothetical protein